MMAQMAWDGGGDGTNWTHAPNWSGDTLPGASDDVTIDVATNPTIRIASGAQSIRSLVSNEALNITGGSLRVADTAEVNNALTLGGVTLFGGTWDVSAGIQVTGTGTLDGTTVNSNVSVQEATSLTVKNAAALNGELTLGANSNLIAGAQVTLACPAVSTLENVNLTATDGAVIHCDFVQTVINVNLAAGSGGQILFPAATSYTSQYIGNRIEASGVGSKIGLPALATFVGAEKSTSQTQIWAHNEGEVVLAGQFKDRTVWILENAGSEFDVRGVTSLSGASLTAANGASWLFPEGWAPELGAGNSLSTSGGGSFINRATLAIAGTSLAINTDAFTNEGTLNPLAGGVFDFNGSFSIDDPGILTYVSTGRISVAGDLLGSTQNAEQFAPQAEVRFDGAGNDTNPQRWEAMSRDLGPFESGFTRNFAFGTVKLANNTYVRLVDESRNTASGAAPIVDEAVYVDTLDVPAGTTLDLNGLHLYARTLQGDGTILNGTVRTDITDDEMADVSLLITCDYLEPNVGQNVTFTVTLSNAGPSKATEVAVADLLPAGLRFVRDTSSQGEYNPTTGVWSVGTVTMGSSATLQIAAEVTGTGTITNTAEVTGADQPDPDSTPGNHDPDEDDQSSVILEPQVADLSLVKTCNDGTPFLDQNVTFTVTLENAGPSEATGIVVTDLLPVALRFVSATSSQGTHSPVAGIWSVGTVAVNSSATLQIVATVTGTGTIINTAEVTAANQHDPDSTPNNREPSEDDQSSAKIEVVHSHPWRNPAQAEDVNGDGLVTPLDVLIMINRLNASGPGDLPVPLPVDVNPPPYWDVDGDDAVSASDVLAVVNFINNHAASGLAASEGEANADAGLTTNSPIETSPFAPQHLPLAAGQASRDKDAVLVDQVFTELAEGNLHA